MVIQFAGYLESGKNTAAQALIDLGWHEESFAKPLKEMSRVLNPFVPERDAAGFSRFVRLDEFVMKKGWHEAKKNKEVRRVLQALGTDCVRELVDRYAWVRLLEDRILKAGNPDTVVTDTRFPNEKIGKLIWVHRPGKGPTGHASEQDLSHLADGIVFNVGTVEQLHEQVLFYARAWKAIE